MAAAERPTLGILGGTGAEGTALAVRWAAAGYPVLLGSRLPARAEEVAGVLAAELAGRPGAVTPAGVTNLEAARDGDIAVLCVPYAAQREMLEQVRPALQGKVLLTAVVPLHRPDVAQVHLPAAGSAAAEAQALLGPAVRVVAAGQNVSATLLRDPGARVDCDILVCGDDPAAKVVALNLVAGLGLIGYDAGPLANAAVVEGLTAVLIAINRRCRARSAGIRITHVPPCRDR